MTKYDEIITAHEKITNLLLQNFYAYSEIVKNTFVIDFLLMNIYSNDKCRLKFLSLQGKDKKDWLCHIIRYASRRASYYVKKIDKRDLKQAELLQKNIDEVINILNNLVMCENSK